MKSLPRVLLIASIAVLTGALAGCGSSQVRIGWVGSRTPGHIGYRYATFAGLETVQFDAEAGQTFYLSCDVEVDKGSLAIEVRDRHGQVLWDRSFREDDADSFKLRLERGGRHTIVIQGHDAGGSFDVTWAVGWEALASSPLG